MIVVPVKEGENIEKEALGDLKQRTAILDYEDKLTEMIEKLYDKMVINSIKNGLCGCVYTQISDVEDEINGMYTYDRQVCKVNKQKMQALAEKLFTTFEKTNE